MIRKGGAADGQPMGRHECAGRVTATTRALMNCPVDLRQCLWMTARGNAMRHGRSMYPCYGQLAVQARVVEPRDERICRRKVRR
jgi:hypothetical protein